MDANAAMVHKPSQRLSVATTIADDDVFPDFSDPNLFSGDRDGDRGAGSLTDRSSELCESISPTVSVSSSSNSPIMPGEQHAALSGGKLLLPIPTNSGNSSQSSFAMSEVDESEGSGFENLPPEVASADISISADGSFVETTSGAAARELKRRYDQQVGVSKDVRSPYIITALINQHGRQVYRVGMRSQSDDASITDSDMDLHVPSSSGLGSPPASVAQRKRRSRMSINDFLPPAMFNKTPSTGSSVHSTSQTSSNHSHKTSDEGKSYGPRKLKKPRSIPDLSSIASGYFDVTAAPQPAFTGRAHSQSVTGADKPRLPIRSVVPPLDTTRPIGDVFCNVMGWATHPASSASSSMSRSRKNAQISDDSTSVDSSDHCSIYPKELLEHPFGRNVAFDSPFRNSAVFSPPPRSVVREKQSFESNRTARAEPSVKSTEGPGPHSPLRSPRHDSYGSVSSSDSDTPASPISSGLPTHPGPRAVPSPESSMYTRYQTSVFDVIQNYRGLPMLDSLSAESRQPTIKMSLSALDGAVPRDDPRFVIWGEVYNDGGQDDKASVQESHTDISSQHPRPLSSALSGNSRKRSIKAKNGSPPELRVMGSEIDLEPGAGGPRRLLMAATIERWIAQLTSQFDYDELLIFFLTYRTYIDATDLCHLLICRFHWALEEPSTPHEVMVKQIVRVRTFVAMRYWLITFFRIDFLSNQGLCLLFANWINTLWKDSILDRFRDARNIVRKLKKVAKDCKDAHSRRSKTSNGAHSTNKGRPMESIDGVLGDLSNGVTFAASLKKAAAEEDEDSDVDLDFNPDESSPFTEGDRGVQGFANFANQLDSSSLNGDAPMEPVASKTGRSPPRIKPSTAQILLQQPLHMTILQHSRSPGSNLVLSESPSALPVHHSALSRVVVNTIGRLGRWKRVLSSRSPATPLAPCGDVNAFDLELNATGDLLAVRGGVEQYLKMIDPSSGSPGSPLSPISLSGPPLLTVEQSTVEVAASEEQSTPTLSPAPVPSVGKRTSTLPQTISPIARAIIEKKSAILLRAESPAVVTTSALAISPATQRHLSVQSYSSDSLKSLDGDATYRSLGNGYSLSENPDWPDIVSIDELELSDTSSTNEQDFEEGPPGLNPPKRRLPMRREFEFVRRSMDSVSSMGIISRASVAASEHVPSSRSSVSSPRGLGQTLQQWQMNALIDDLSDDGDGSGDVEAALRRLEGQISPQQKRMKEIKVDGWVKTIQERMAAGDFSDERPRFPSSDDESFDEAVKQISLNTEADTTISVSSSGRNSEDSDNPPFPPGLDVNDGGTKRPVTPTPRHTAFPSSGSDEAKPRVDEAVPIEILQSRLPSRPSTSSGRSNNNSSGPAPAVPVFVSPYNTIVHRSFVLQYKSEVLAQHFAVIDREIFLGIKFDELVSDNSMELSEELNVLDWQQFLRDRRRKAELRGGRISVLAAARARFNLVTNFVVSEIALTNAHDRVILVSKFIRIAWKAYTQNNFATLVAIISGLSSDGVRKAMGRSWSRVGIWEMRVLDDLRAFATSEDDFRYIRKAVAAMADAKPLNVQDDSNASTGPTDGSSSVGSRGRSGSESKFFTPTSCVPFIGIYLSQLYRFNKLPDLIDPSAPTESVDIDRKTGNFKSPAHTEVFAELRPLPSSMQIEPLINVQKQRKIAGVIKFLVAGQHLANKVVVETDKKLLSRCLRLRALDYDALQKVLGAHPDN